MFDYLYGSARLRALESAIIGRDRLEQLLDAKSYEDALTRLHEFGVEVIKDPTTAAFLREATLLRILKSAYAEVAELTPDNPVVRLWLYPYDCNNLKAALKGFVRTIDPRSMMFDFGNIGIEEILSMVQTQNYEALPEAMRAGAETAVTAYAKTRNPQQIDLILDRACYQDMLADAERSESDVVVHLVRTRIDLINFMICVRILRMKNGENGIQLLRRSLLDGGRLSTSDLLTLVERGEDKLWDRLYYSEYENLAKLVSSQKSLTFVECQADNFLMREMKQAKYAAYGPEVFVAFLLAHEYEVRNLRIVLSGKEAGIDRETIRERIRESYV